MGVSAHEAVRAARDRLKAAYFGLEDMVVRPNRYHSGLMNAVVFGRMVTLALQNMRGSVDGWEEWYAVRQEEMRANPLFRYFLDLRNRIEKQTSAGAVVSGHIKSFSTADMALFRPAPPGATAFVMGSARHGGASGWMVSLPDGDQELFVVDLPEHIGVFFAHMPDGPDGWHGKSATEMVEAYLDSLSSLVDEVQREFVK